MSPITSSVHSRARRSGWCACVQLMGAAVFAMAAGAGAGSAPATPPDRADAMGGPYIAVGVDGAGGGLAALAGTPVLDSPGARRDDAFDLAATLWTSPQADDREGLPQLLPVTPVRVTSGFGRRHDPFGHGDAFHSGVDFAGAVGTPVHASGDGIVVQARYSKDYGNVVMIDHGQGVVTLYAHNSRLEVRTGDVVLAGQEIAKMGSTGRSTGPHLHFEVRQSGQRIDPGRYLAGI